jgi:predicted nucleic acid-binding protein
MTTPKTTKLRVFIDADVLFAGSASPGEHSASLVLLRMAELTLIEAFVSQQVIDECRRNLFEKMPDALPAFHMLVSRCTHVVPDPIKGDIAQFAGFADPKDLPILVAAYQSNCAWLVTFNSRHYRPGHPEIMVSRPGELVLRVRELLARFPSKETE